MPTQNQNTIFVSENNAKKNDPTNLVWVEAKLTHTDLTLINPEGFSKLLGNNDCDNTLTCRGACSSTPTTK